MPTGYKQEGAPNDFTGPARQGAPTEAPPGSPDKIAELRQRARRHESLFQERDTTGEGRINRRVKLTGGNHVAKVGSTYRDTRAQAQRGKCRPAPEHLLGGRIYRLRTDRGWSQGQLARRVGLHRRYISHLERGMQRPSVHTLIALADAFLVSLDHLVGRTPPAA